MHEIECTQCQLLTAEWEDLRKGWINKGGKNSWCERRIALFGGVIDVWKGEQRRWLYVILSIIYYFYVCRWFHCTGTHSYMHYELWDEIIKKKYALIIKIWMKLVIV